MQIPIIPHRGQTKPWTSIPRINWQHPLAKGLVFYAYDTGGGLVVDLVDGLKPSLITAAIGTAPSQQGSGRKYTSGGGAINFANATNIVKIFPASLYSMATAWNITALPSVTSTCPFGINDASGNNAIAVIWNITTSNDLEAIVANTNAGSFASNTANAFHSFVVTNTSATSQVTYFDGKSAATSAITAAFTATAYQPTFNTFVTGAAPSGNGVAGLIFYGALWNRTITSSEARKLHDDPYCFLIYPEDEMFATLVGASTFTWFRMDDSEANIIEYLKRNEMVEYGSQ